MTAADLRRSRSGSHPAAESSSLTSAEHRAREELLTQSQASRIASTLDAIVLERGGLFLLTDVGGDVPFATPHALGLYLDDCRFLDGFVLAIGGRSPISLSSTDDRGFETTQHLVNPDLEGPDGAVAVPANTLSIQRFRCIHEGALYEEIAIANHGAERVAISAELRFRARFQDVFVVKQFVADAGPHASARVSAPDLVEHRRRGRDGTLRRTRFHFEEAPTVLGARRARFDLVIEPRSCRRLRLCIEPCIGEPARDAARSLGGEAIRRQLEAARAQPDPVEQRFRSPSGLFDRVLRRAVLDLRLLESHVDGKRYFTAGIPWFATLFGRDAATVALQVLPWQQRTARDTLELLARYQAKSRDEYRDAQSGRILHELRRGELAHLGTIPQSPAYYGSLDATPLFLILLCAYVRWSGDLDLARALHPQVERALDWMAGEADSDRDGFLDYRGAYENGLVNQGWKDSGDAMVDAEGACAEPPIAPCEVQGYAYRAWRDVAALWRALGEDEARAASLDARARAIQERFERRFWSDTIGCYVLGLEAGGRPLAVASSNAGHVLWTGIASRERAARVAERMLAPDLFSGWGVRTLSADARGYNPVSYHRGSVWPHDNALILAGFRRYGLDDAALRLFEALFDAASWCRNDRLPELFCGFSRSERERGPVPYPVACSPQAWAAGALPFALWTLLGLAGDAARGRLLVRRPCLPEDLDALEVRNLCVGGAEADLRVRRSSDGALDLDLDVRGGDLELVRDDRPFDDA